MAHLELVCNIALTWWIRYSKIYSDELEVEMKDVIMIMKVTGRRRARRKQTDQSN